MNSDLLNLITGRRSIRAFEAKKVPNEFIQQIAYSALAAPSSKNSNPWFIVTVSGEAKATVVTWFREAAMTSAGQSARVPIDPETRTAWETVSDTVDESIATADQCDTLILLFNRAPFSRSPEVLINLFESPARSSTKGQALYGYAGEMVGLGAAAQNMMLAARALGLGSVYMADTYPLRERIKRELSTTKELVGVIAIGYAAYDPGPRARQTELVKDWREVVGQMDRVIGGEKG